MPASIGCVLVDGEVWLFAEPDEIERADYFPLRTPAGHVSGKSRGGQYRSASSAVLGALENWINDANAPDDPFEGRDKSGRLEFSTRALETAAGQLGVPPVPQRTDPETGRRIDRRPALKLALLEAARRQVRAQRAENVDKAFDHGGSRYSPPPGTRRNVRGRDGSSLGYMVFEREGGDRGDTWAAYRDDGVLLGHFETIPEAHDALQRKGAIPDGTRLRFADEAFAVRKDGGWEVHVPAVVQPGDSPLLPDEPGRVVGTADTPEAAQALAQREMTRRRPRPRAATRPAAPAQDLTGARGLSDDPAVRAVQVENRIREAYGRVRARRQTQADERARTTGRGMFVPSVPLADLRNELGESTPRPEIDAALIRMGRERGISLLPNEDLKSRTQADKDSALFIGPQHYDSFEMEDWSPRPLPAASAPPRPRKPSAIKSTPGRPMTQRERAAEAVLNGRVSADDAKRLLGGQTPEQILQQRNQTPRDRAYDRLTAPQKAAVDALAPNQANVYWGRRLEGDKAPHAAAMKSLPAPVWPAEPEGDRISYAARLSSASEGRAPRGTILSREGHTATVRWDETGRTETGVPLGDLKDLPAPAPLSAPAESYLRTAAASPDGVAYGKPGEMAGLRQRGLVKVDHIEQDDRGRAVRFMAATQGGRDYLDERDAQVAREAAKTTEAATYSVGFTGTRAGMTPSQKAQFRARLREIKAEHPNAEFHHGSAVGADAEAAQIAREEGFRVVSHPSNLPAQTATTVNDETLPAKPPLTRNRDIVAASDVMLAAPRTDKEERRSGTWATIRHARETGVPLEQLSPSAATDLGSLSDAELLQRLRDRGLSTDGSRSDWLARLRG